MFTKTFDLNSTTTSVAEETSEDESDGLVMNLNQNEVQSAKPEVTFFTSFFT